MVVLRPVLPPPSQPFFNDRDIGNAEILTQVKRGGEAVTARAHNDDVILLLGLRRPPCAFPAGVEPGGFAGDGKG